jgi:hypothetical protein
MSKLRELIELRKANINKFHDTGSWWSLMDWFDNRADEIADLIEACEDINGDEITQSLDTHGHDRATSKSDWADIEAMNQSIWNVEAALQALKEKS